MNTPVNNIVLCVLTRTDAWSVHMRPLYEAFPGASATEDMSPDAALSALLAARGRVEASQLDGARKERELQEIHRGMVELERLINPPEERPYVDDSYEGDCECLFVVSQQVRDYDDRETRIRAVFTTQNAAEAFVKKAAEWRNFVITRVPVNPDVA